MRTVRGLLTITGILAAVATAPWALLLVFGAGVQQNGGDHNAPAWVLIATVALVGLACFVAVVPSSRSGALQRACALMCIGALCVGASVAIPEWTSLNN